MDTNLRVLSCRGASGTGFQPVIGSPSFEFRVSRKNRLGPGTELIFLEAAIFFILTFFLEKMNSSLSSHLRT
jgi:hypothetical protein